MSSTTNPAGLRELTASFTAGDAGLLPTAEAWKQMLLRIRVVSRTHQITEELFDYFLEALLP